MCAALALMGLHPLPAGAALMQNAQWRHPIVIVATSDALIVANQRSGTLSMLDPVTIGITQELKLGRQLSDLVALPNGDLLACDQSSGELIRLNRNGASLRATARLCVGTSPVSICASNDGKWCSVALLWAHQIALVDSSAMLAARKTIDLPFAPRKQCLLPDGKTLVVADSFGQGLAVIDVPAGTVRAIRSVQGHNIRGLCLSPDGSQLLLSHPILSQGLSTTESNIFWGSVVSNAIRAIEIRHVLNLPPPAEVRDPESPVVPIGHWSLYPLGEQGNAAGDPGDLKVSRHGKVVVALSGVNEVAIGQLRDGQFQRVRVGLRPTSVAISPDGDTAYVANTLDDSVSVVDLNTPQLIRTLSLGPTPPLTAADRGERLFFDSRLSKDNWFSCNTCHTDGHTCGLLNDNFSDGSFGTPKRILSLLGVADTAPYAWNGSNATLEEQIHKSILSTMAGKKENAFPQNIADLAAFIRTLPPAPGLAVARRTIDSAAIERGRHAFEQWDCDHCHEPPRYTSDRTFDVALPDEHGQSRWNPPSLRGVSQLPAFFHDNRAATLRDALYRDRHPHGSDIPEGQVEELIAFLESL